MRRMTQVRSHVHQRHGSDARDGRANSIGDRNPMFSPITDGAEEGDTESLLDGGSKTPAKSPPPPTWANIPHKDQLAILACSRLVDFFQMAALQTFMVHQLHSFDKELPDKAISHQAGLLQGSFTAVQIVTAVLWGRVADAPWCGRKRVLLIGLIGTGISCVMIGFSTTFLEAVVWRTLGGAINGTVGSARTMVAEVVDKPWHSRAFLLLPVAFNVANILGPILGGLLTDPIESFPNLVGPGSIFGGQDGVWWMKAYPFALANILCAILLFVEAIVVKFFLRETLDIRKFSLEERRPPWVEFRAFLNRFFGRGTWGRGWLSRRSYAPLGQNPPPSPPPDGLLSGGAMEMTELGSNADRPPPALLPKPKPRLPMRRIWTANVVFTLMSIAVFDFHMGAFSSLWIIFLSTSRNPGSVPSHPGPPPPDTLPAGDVRPPPNALPHAGPGPGHGGIHPRGANAGGASGVIMPRSPFYFNNGLAFPPATIGFAMAILGVVGLGLQVIFYPWANARFGLLRSFRLALFLFPLAYFLAPYIALLPSSTPAPGPASGFWVWFGIAVVLTCQVAARTFALPASIILLNNASPHPSVLGTIHGVGQSVSSTFRTIGPIASGYWYGIGLEVGAVGFAWWVVAAISALGCVVSWWVEDGAGKQIVLPGEDDDGPPEK